MAKKKFKLKFQEWRWLMKSYGAEVQCSSFSNYAVAVLYDDMISEFQLPRTMRLEDNPEAVKIQIWTKAAVEKSRNAKIDFEVRWTNMAYANTEDKVHRYMKEAIADYDFKLKKYKKEKILSICKEKFTDE